MPVDSEEILRDKKILLIEDDENSRLLVKQSLKIKGVGILEASTGEDGLNLAKENSVDAILLDVGLPDISGIDLIEKLKRLDHLADTPIVALTAFVSKKNIDLFQRSGFCQCISKPIDVAIFPKEVAYILSNHTNSNHTK